MHDLCNPLLKEIAGLISHSCIFSLFVPLQVETKLIRRLSYAILSWTECLMGVIVEGGVDTTSMDTTPSTNQSQHKLGGTPELEVRGKGEGEGGGEGERGRERGLR